MGFFLISLYFLLSGLVGSLCVKVCYNKGPSTNMLNVVLVNTAVICCWLMWAIVWLAQWKPLINPVLKAEGE
ncbi:V-type proton ATPase subunit e1 [Physcomitrium patens]|uniref:Uncharacterized protein n=1 Tax=Physcomitrium patens TaxID=3218 RepID=A0A2K1JT77_PHYPA|nr:V-type proton ATPase subunit e1-like [Physcomitrium patens]PNR44744.1 hypothetical protein PHYPA_014514 [Physcomitrium patens]|eukprot:XP_024389071.1 V-type proton ATPase subunit e1-like [Physcomitrella patens]